MNKLLNLKTSSNFVDIIEIRSLYNDIEVQVRSIRGIGLEEKRYDPMLAPVIMSKLPQEIKLTLTRKFGKDICEIDKLLNSLRDEVEAREKVRIPLRRREVVQLCIYRIRIEEKLTFGIIVCTAREAITLENRSS